VPYALTTYTGITQILPADQISYLDVPITMVMEFVEKYGVGVEGLLARKVSEQSSEERLDPGQVENETPEN
jgi:hypothetical protein